MRDLLHRLGCLIQLSLAAALVTAALRWTGLHPALAVVLAVPASMVGTAVLMLAADQILPDG